MHFYFHVKEISVKFIAELSEIHTFLYFYVKEIPVEFMAELSEIHTEEHKMAFFQCEVNKDDVTVTWLKDDEALTPSNKHIMEDDGHIHTLVIKDVDKADVAEYAVIVGDKKSSARLHLDGEFILI